MKSISCTIWVYEIGIGCLNSWKEWSGEIEENFPLCGFLLWKKILKIFVLPSPGKLDQKLSLEK